MKQLSALGARRHAFFRSPRRMRPLGGRLDESEMLGSTPYTYYGGKGPLGRPAPSPPSGSCAAAARSPLTPPDSESHCVADPSARYALPAGRALPMHQGHGAACKCTPYTRQSTQSLTHPLSSSPRPQAAPALLGSRRNSGCHLGKSQRRG